uniref:Uncharacterized protein n=1 Tax=Anguilla anguilla TaxID=7936 RepID=A0A0E9P752_ANGAN
MEAFEAQQCAIQYEHEASSKLTAQWTIMSFSNTQPIMCMQHDAN